ncbi:hypothetical protein LTR10_023130 [Elasticomyces elasticus]|uniref:AB hydrolase-1 domain-containing protein n=1 Tax=Exophiala sideris TaxID=1016849 RepID=A0ABR0JKH1_9EURO|nr:hypothetical protein LTR10_023130 [Elasticomyces elasticus]KAK5035551.1 hypothetical protein LTS07_002990 [Exophiala sideris]KAK5039098.1 hypothetical protein LTR13_003353 [Exophiala sideris]KAK5066476.1 hypothetical protein LTR69_002996 [Exophiala sideris]KAK5187153.1 hypothetical protein LTR44_001161 [Eurotiomycetes sp. CCFEE 6388]
MAEHVRSQGYEIVVDTLPSCSRAPPERPATMAEDAVHFHDIAEKLADQGKEIVMVMHSYGGVVGTECSKGLSRTERKEAGKAGGIIKLVYFTCVVPGVGISLRELLPGDDLPWLIVRDDVPEESAQPTFSDLPKEEGIEWCRKMPLHSLASYEGKLTYPAYKYIRSSWIFCEKDQVLNPDLQRSFIEMIEKESGNKVDVHNLAMPHCPNISAPLQLANVVVKAVAAN